MLYCQSRFFQKEFFGTWKRGRNDRVSEIGSKERIESWLKNIREKGTEIDRVEAMKELREREREHEAGEAGKRSTVKKERQTQKEKLDFFL